MPASIDLIHLGAPDGNKVVVRVRGIDPEIDYLLVGEIIVTTGFVKGRQKTWIFPEDLAEWESALATLASGRSCFW